MGVAGQEVVAVARTQEQPACPRCGSSEKVVPIVYGLPHEEAERAAARGEVWLLACCRPPARAWRPWAGGYIQVPK